MAVTGRYTYYFRAGSGQAAGWTENFWNMTDTAGPNVSRMNILRDALLLVHSATTNINHIRWSRVGDTVRATQSFTPPNGTTNINPMLTSDIPQDYPATALLLKMTNGNVQTRQWLKGMPDELSSFGGSFTPGRVEGGQWMSSFTALANILKDNGWCMRTRDTSKPRQDITSISTAGLIVFAGPAIPFGSLVYISRPNGSRYAQGFWRTADPGPDVIGSHLVGFAPPIGTPAWGPGGKIQWVDGMNTPITGAFAERVTKHDVGRPFGLLTGRRRRRR